MCFSVPKSSATVSSTQLSSMTSSYTCTAPRVIKFKTVEGKDGEEYDFSMTISDVQIQAFNVTGTSYSPGKKHQNILQFTFSQITHSSYVLHFKSLSCLCDVIYQIQGIFCIPALLKIIKHLCESHYAGNICSLRT